MLCGDLNEKEIQKRGDACVRVADPLCCTADTNAALQSNYESESRSVVSDSLQPRELYHPWTSPGQNTGVGSLSLLQGSSQPRDQTGVSCIAGGSFTN